MNETIILLFRKHLGSLIRLLEYAQRFFPASATQEILDEFLPQFSTSEIRDALRVIGYLVLLLPASIPRNSQTHAILDKDNNGMHPKEFLPTLFSLWSMITISPTCDAQFVELLSRMAEENISDEYTAEIGLFDRQQVRYIFTVGMRMMNLPVGSQESGGSRPGGSTGFGSNGQRTDLKAGNALALRHKPVSSIIKKEGLGWKIIFIFYSFFFFGKILLFMMGSTNQNKNYMVSWIIGTFSIIC